MNESAYWDLQARGARALHEVRFAEAEDAFRLAQTEAKQRRLFNLADRAFCNRVAARLVIAPEEDVREDLSMVLGRSSDLKARQLAAYYLAFCHGTRGNLKAARLYAEMSSRLAESAGDLQGQASSLHSLGWLCLRENRFDSAKEGLRKSLEISTRIGASAPALMTMSTLGYCLSLIGSCNESLWFLEESLEAMTQPNCSLYLPSVRLNLGFAYLEFGDFDDAIEQGEAALVALRERRASQDAKFAYYLLGEAHAQKEDERTAGDYFEALQKAYYPQYPELRELLLAERTSRWVSWLI